MAWTNSKIFSATMEDVLENTTAIDLNADTINVALFDNTVTPSQTVASANTAYGAGVWAAGGAGDTFSSNVVTFDAPDTVSADATTDLASVFGCLVYDDTVAAPVADQGVCFNYFGGSNSVVNGTFTVVWNASGILALTL